MSRVLVSHEKTDSSFPTAIIKQSIVLADDSGVASLLIFSIICCFDLIIISGGRVTFINEDALKYNIPKEADRFFFFNPFSVEIFNCVLANIMDSYGTLKYTVVVFYANRVTFGLVSHEKTDSSFPTAIIKQSIVLAIDEQGIIIKANDKVKAADDAEN